MATSFGLCMIVRDEAENLARCLDSVAGIFDEIVILDTGSTDATEEIARTYTDRFFRYVWKDDFAAARNAAFAYATSDYVMCLDADEVLSRESKRLLAEYKRKTFEHRTMLACRCLTELDENGAVSSWSYQARIFAGHAKPEWHGFVAECVEWTADILLTQITVTHEKVRSKHAERTLDIMRRRLDEVKCDPRLHAYFAKRLKDCGLAVAAKEELTACLCDDHTADDDRVQICRTLAQLAREEGERDKDLEYLLKALTYGVPTAELACEIGGRLIDRDRFRQAAYWYHQALLAPRDPYQLILEEAHGFLPYVMLTVCYDRMGERTLALQYHQLAQKIKPNNKYVIYNQQYLDTMSHITEKSAP